MKFPIPHLMFITMILVLGAAIPSGAAEMKSTLLAGVGVANITPDTTTYHVPLGGYGERQNAAALGVHDDAMAKAIILKQDDKKFCLVTTDLLGIARSLREEVLARISDLGIASENLMLTASHCHASTEMNAMNRQNVFNNPAIGIFDEALLTFTADQIALAIRRADKGDQPVTVGTASTTVEGLNRNRRNDPIVDKELTVARFDKADGSPLVIFVNWTAHPTYMNPNVMHVSAGWPGYLQREVEGFSPAGTLCMYTNGAEGDIAPAGGQGPSEYARAEDYGRKLAKEVLALSETIDTTETSMAFAMHTLELPAREAPPALLDAAGPEYGLTPENIQTLVETMSPESSYLGVLQLGDLLALAVPGEMTSELGVQVKDALKKQGSAHPIIVGLGNEWISYILPTEEYHQGGYEPGVSFYGDQLGPVVTRQVIAAGAGILKR